MFHQISGSHVAGRAHCATSEVLGALAGTASVIFVVVAALVLIG